LDKHIRNTEYFAGASLTIADISIAGVMVCLYNLVLGEKIVVKLEFLTAWFKKVAELPAFKKYFKVEFCQ